VEEPYKLIDKVNISHSRSRRLKEAGVEGIMGD
jgi:hypothetical protein